MSESDELDIQALLQPFEGADPAGIDLRNAEVDDSMATLNQLLKAANLGINPEEISNVAHRENREAKKDLFSLDPMQLDAFIKVRDTAVRMLTEHSKDMEVAAVLCKVMTILGGFRGLHQGLELMLGLLDTFKDRLYPRVSDSIAEGKFNGQALLMKPNGAGELGLVFAITRVPLISSDSTVVNLAHVREAFDKKGIGAVFSNDRIKKLLSSYPAEKIESQKSMIKDCEAIISDFLESVLAVVGDPPLPRDASMPAIKVWKWDKVIEALGACRKFYDDFSGTASSAPAAGGAGGSSFGFGFDPGGGASVSESRRAAFETIRQVSNYLKSIEPHSPVPFLLDKAVRWSTMDLPDLWVEIIRDATPREEVFRLVGIVEKKAPEVKENSS